MLGCSQFTKGNNFVKTIDGFRVLNRCTLSDDVLYLYQVSRKYLKRFQLLSGTISIPKCTKGHNPAKRVVGVMALIQFTSLIMLYICKKFC